MKAAPTLCCLSLAGAIAASPTAAQSAGGRARGQSQSTTTASRAQALSFHNPYTGGSVSAEILFPAQTRPLAAVVLLAGSSAREQQAAGALRSYLAQSGYAVLTPPPIGAAGPSEDDNLNVIAVLHYLQTRPELRAVPVGLIGYGEGVPLAAVAASQGNPAAFLLLLGGAVVPDRLNTLPENLSHGALPKDEAVKSLQHVRCPVLIVMGEYDRQGTHRTAAENNDALRATLDAGRHENYTVKVLNDSDSLLADTGAGGSRLSSALPPASVWHTAVDWIGKQVRALDPVGSSDYTESGQRKPIRLYPKSVYGPFNWRPSYIWAPAIGDQPRPFGFWYW